MRQAKGIGRCTQIGYSSSKTIISGLYIWSLLWLLKLKKNVQQRRLCWIWFMSRSMSSPKIEQTGRLGRVEQEVERPPRHSKLVENTTWRYACSTVGSAKHITWQMNQNKLASLLLVTGPSALSLFELNTEKTATERYIILENAFNMITVTTFSTLYRRISECRLSNRKFLKEYGEDIANARNKLKGLQQPLDELAVTCAFLSGLGKRYQERRTWSQEDTPKTPLR